MFFTAKPISVIQGQYGQPSFLFKRQQPATPCKITNKAHTLIQKHSEIKFKQHPRDTKEQRF